MGAMAKGRSVQAIGGAFELRETQYAYKAIFTPENRQIDPKLACFYVIFSFIVVG